MLEFLNQNAEGLGLLVVIISAALSFLGWLFHGLFIKPVKDLETKFKEEKLQNHQEHAGLEKKVDEVLREVRRIWQHLAERKD